MRKACVALVSPAAAGTPLTAKSQEQKGPATGQVSDCIGGKGSAAERRRGTAGLGHLILTPCRSGSRGEQAVLGEGVQQVGWGLGFQDRLLLQPQARVLGAEWGKGCVAPVAGDVTGINTD